MKAILINAFLFMSIIINHVALAKQGDNALGSVRQSICFFVCLFVCACMLSYLKHLT